MTLYLRIKFASPGSLKLHNFWENQCPMHDFKDKSNDEPKMNGRQKIDLNWESSVQYLPLKTNRASKF